MKLIVLLVGAALMLVTAGCEEEHEHHHHEGQGGYYGPYDQPGYGHGEYRPGEYRGYPNYPDYRYRY